MTLEIPSSFIPSYAQGLSILLVGDDTTAVTYIVSMLEQYTFKVTTTELATVALTMIQEDKDRFRLVMANVDMVDVDIYEFVRLLLDKDVPVILIAPERDLHVARKALHEGAAFYLYRPISLDDLKYVWQHAFRKRRIFNNSNETQTETAAENLNSNGTDRSRPQINIPIGSTNPIGSAATLPATNHQNLTDDTKGKGKVFELGALNATAAYDHQNMMINDTSGSSTNHRFEMNGTNDDNHERMTSNTADPKGKGKIFHMDLYDICHHDQHQGQQHMMNDHEGNSKQNEVEALHDTLNHDQQMMTDPKTQRPLEVGFGLADGENNSCRNEPDAEAVEHWLMALESQKEGGGDDKEGEKKKKSGKSNEEDNEQSTIHEEQEKERTLPSNEEEDKEKEEDSTSNNYSKEKKPRVAWTPALHLKFTTAVSALGDKKARPKQILDMMNEPSLTQRQIASHLQKYKNQIQRMCENATIDSTATGNKPFIFTAKREDIERPGTVRSRLRSRRLNFGIQGSRDIFRLLTAPTNVVGRDIRAPYSVENQNKFLMTTAVTTRRLEPSAGKFNFVNEPNSFKFPTTFVFGKADAMRLPNSVSEYVPNADKFRIDFSGVNRKLNAIATSTDHPASSKNQSGTGSDYTDLVTVLQEDHIDSPGLPGGPSPQEIDQYCELLNNVLLGNNP